MHKYIALALVITLNGCSITQGNFVAGPMDDTGIQVEGTQQPKVMTTPIPTDAITPIQTPKPTRPQTLNPIKLDGQLDSLPNKKMAWGFKKLPNAQPQFTNEEKKLMEKYDCIYMGSDSDKSIYLTFDEGYENGYSGEILDVLKEKNVPAAFFVTGSFATNQKALMTRMVEEGHIVGNHTANHPSLPEITPEQLKDELWELNEIYYEQFGHSMSFMRAPKGEYSERVLAISKELGLTNVFWSFAYVDWDINDQKGEEHAYNEVMKYLHNGAVLLLHAVSSDNAKALPRIIDEAKRQGYVFKALDEFPRSEG